MSPNDKPAGHPVRRCASCRTRREASRLVRLVASEDGEVRVDLERRMSGRGLNLCPSPDCFHDALRKNLLRRSLGVTQRCDLESLISSLREVAHESLVRLISHARSVDGVERVDRSEASPKAYRELLTRQTGDERLQTLPGLSLRNPRIAARAGRLSDLLNRFTIEPPGAKTRRPDSEHCAESRTAVESRASGEL